MSVVRCPLSAAGIHLLQSLDSPVMNIGKELADFSRLTIKYECYATGNGQLTTDHGHLTTDTLQL